ncbi:tetratricopeptide repeat protein [Oxalobacter vibrioformis]|uniref:Tetratricopeptide repeat protein n=1 Tax=Oxalobacter vibrioformis TaxID=933080 RepID=A0A9E9LTV8_9BURK|nr:tetratricopeptide repeat protein [Oxalobacter vibrioformis]WAW09545.1 tetratricopeptide repeat protein [Oxalobacter vibrioformis]
MAAMKSGTGVSSQSRQALPHLLKALDLHGQQQFDAALACYDKAIALDPDFAEAYANRGLLYMETSESVLALADLSRAIALKPDFLKAYINRGALYVKSKENVLALADLDRAIELNPDMAEAYTNRAALHMEANERELALADLDRAIELNPDIVQAYTNRGILYVQSNDNTRALADLDRAIALAPDFVDAYRYRGLALVALRQHEAAFESLEKALLLNPSSADVYHDIGMAFVGSEQLDVALEYFEKALALNPELVSAYVNYGNTLLKRNAYDAAIELYDKALALDPDYIHARYNKAFPLLLKGHLEEGWPLYESRLNVSALKLRKMDVPGRLWLGEESIQGKTLLFSHDMGYGDTIQLCRYTKLASRQGAKVILQVQPPLLGLMETLEGVDELVAHSEELTPQTLDKYPPFDLYCPMMSLPLAFHTTLETIPGEVPYLFADPEKVAQWEKRLGSKTKPRVGLVWSGNFVHANDHNRSITLSHLLPYLPDSCEYISLQKDVRDIDKIILSAMTEWKHYGEMLQDFSDTAALCSLMDVVISVDTSVAHLSGALGKPTWVMLPFSPDWRWLLDRKDSPWYPGMRLYRQKEPGNWNDVFEEVRSDLLGLAAGEIVRGEREHGAKQQGYPVSEKGRIEPESRLAHHVDTFCKICGEKAFLLDVVDFNKSCLAEYNRKEPLSGIPVYYHGCFFCDFIFTTHFDSWTNEDFMRHIYNDRYVSCDPDFAENRPIGTAQWIEQQFPHFRALKILDFGSGHGLFGSYLNARGFDVTSYDPFYGDSAPPPAGSFDLVLATEVVEHSHTPLQTIEQCVAFLKQDGPAAFIASTLMTPAPVEELRHRLSTYWYAGPRNGHISLFSEKTMQLIAKRSGALYTGGQNAAVFHFRGFEKKIASPPSQDVVTR